jgi:ferredoxin
MRVYIDAAKCRGHALCLSHAPEVFEFVDLEDRSVVNDDAVGSVAPEVLLAAARECPEQAIVIELTAGEATP